VKRAEPEHRHFPPDPEQPVNILAVDDNPGNLLALEVALESLGQNIVKAASGVEALQQVMEKDFALILLDVEMPGMDGFEAATLIRQREGARPIPIVFLTASDGTEAQMFKGYSLGAVDYLYKPIVPEVLKAKVRAFVELYRKNQEVHRQAELLREAERREHERDIVRAREQWEAERLRQEMHKERDLARALTQKADELAGTISERQLVEAELRATNSALQTLVQASPLAIVVLAAGFIKAWNPAASQIFGWRDHEVIGKASQSLFIDRRDIFAEIAHRVGQGEVLTDVEMQARRRDGEEIFLNVAAAPLTVAASPVGAGILAVITDVSEKRRLETQLRQSQKLEAVGQLAGGIAHDFNNLLTVILGRSQMLQEKLERDSPLRHDVDLIFTTGERAASLTRQLLAFSRKQVLHPRILDLNNIVSDMEKMLRRLIGEDIELATVLDPKLGAAKVDAGQIEQVIMNLAVNARDAMPQGGKLLIETANAVLDESYARLHATARPGSYVMLSVTDSGCGMDSQTQSHIFEPFFTTKELGKGTGLGLATVYGIVNQSGGSIWVYSELGRGSSFKVYLPRIDETTSKAEGGGHGRSHGGSETILLVEDDQFVRELAAEILRRAGYHVLIAANGPQAIDVSGTFEDHIHLIITDVIMPKMNGPELIKKLLATRPGMKTLVMSGYTDAAMTQIGDLGPKTEFLQKPFTMDAFTRKVREVLGVRI
jgi:two-component system, cell cycle sensor histidine kinase and response regulator CckA